MLSYANGGELDAADAHLAAADPVMADLIRQFGPVDEDLGVPLDDLYGALILAITSQQLSTHSARAIYGRLTARFGGQTPAPQALLADDPDTLRTSTGLSHAKVAYGLGAVPDPATLTGMGEPWRPYRTRACLYLWRSVQAVPAPATPRSA